MQSGFFFAKQSGDELVPEVEPSPIPSATALPIPAATNSPKMQIKPQEKAETVSQTVSYSLTIRTNPSSAKIVLADIKQVYKPGLALPAGKYRVEVSAPGYQTKTLWANLENGAQDLAVSLQREVLASGTRFKDELKVGGVGPEVIVIPAGQFSMGSRRGRVEEQPVRRVDIGNAFAMGRFEVTFDEYDLFAEMTDRSFPEDQNWGRGEQPIVNVTWYDATAYVEWLSQQTGQSYRLPTEAEWEYAARAGTTTRYHFGSEISRLCAYGNSADGGGFARSEKNCTDGYPTSPAPVGSFQSNKFGLYDTHGNVWEWVMDCWNTSYAGAPTDGSSWNAGSCSERVIRGGSWATDHRFVEVNYRTAKMVNHNDYSIGFRVVRELK